MRSVVEVSLLPLLALPVRLVHPLPFWLRLRMLATRKPRCLLPPLGRPGVGGSHLGGDCSATDRDCFSQLGPSGHGSGLRSSLGTARFSSRFGG